MTISRAQMYRQLYQMGGIGTLPMNYGQPLQVSQPNMNPSFGSMQSMMPTAFNTSFNQMPMMAGGGITRLGYQGGGMDAMTMEPQMQDFMMQEQMMQPPMQEQMMQAPMQAPMQGQMMPAASNEQPDQAQGETALLTIIQLLIEQGIDPETAKQIAVQILQTFNQGGEPAVEAFANQLEQEEGMQEPMMMAGGGIMSVRQNYGLGSIFKKVGNAVKSIIKSPIGKAALIGAMAVGIPRTGIGGSLKNFLFGKAAFLKEGAERDAIPGIFNKLGLTKNPGSFMPTLSGGILGTSLLSALDQQPGESDDMYKLRARTDPEVAKYITQYGGNLGLTDRNFYAMEGAAYPTFAANGGRIGYKGGGMDRMMSNEERQLDVYKRYLQAIGEEEYNRIIKGDLERFKKQLYDRKFGVAAADGGRIGYSVGGFGTLIKGASKFLKGVSRSVINNLAKFRDDIEITPTNYDYAEDVGESYDIIIKPKTKKGLRIMEELVSSSKGDITKYGKDFYLPQGEASKYIDDAILKGARASGITTDGGDFYRTKDMYQLSIGKSMPEEDVYQGLTGFGKREPKANGGRIGYQNAGMVNDNTGIMQMASAPDPMDEFDQMKQDIAEKYFGKSLKDLSNMELIKLEELMDQMDMPTFARGGRAGFKGGGINYASAVLGGEDEDIAMQMWSNMDPDDRNLYKNFNDYFQSGDWIEQVKQIDVGMMANGGRIGYEYGSMPMGEPRKNPAGIMELDYRAKGGFVPPIGIKEKADDIPAMLSNNEFVFTANAVRGAGGGSVNKGAERMYGLMKKLESGIA